MTNTPPNELHRWDLLVLSEANKFGLDPVIVSAVIWKECEEDIGNPRLTRFEPRWQYFWHPIRHALWQGNLSWKVNRDVATQLLGQDEFLFQSTSWSLCQVMGAVGRELGFEGSPKEFCIPETAIHYGCMHLSNFLRRSHGDYKMALTHYNGSPIYSVEVLRRADILEQS